MRRFAPVGLAIFLLLLLTGCGPGIGLDDDLLPLCSVGCILDVYPCRDPVTNASEVGPHCPAQPFDTVVHSLAWDALLLALAALALVVGAWWWLGRRPAKEPPDDDDGPSSRGMTSSPGSTPRGSRQRTTSTSSWRPTTSGTPSTSGCCVRARPSASTSSWRHGRPPISQGRRH
jgi:hypothetical protein